MKTYSLEKALMLVKVEGKRKRVTINEVGDSVTMIIVAPLEDLKDEVSERSSWRKYIYVFIMNRKQFNSIKLI